MELDRLKNTAMVVVASIFSLFSIWDITQPLEQQLVEQLIQVIFLILGAIGTGLFYERVQLSKVSIHAVDFNKIRDTGILVIASIFSIAGIWQLSIPVDEQIITQFFSLLISIISLFFGGTRATRLYFANKV